MPRFTKYTKRNKKKVNRSRKKKLKSVQKGGQVIYFTLGTTSTGKLGFSLNGTTWALYQDVLPLPSGAINTSTFFSNIANGPYSITTNGTTWVLSYGYRSLFYSNTITINGTQVTGAWFRCTFTTGFSSNDYRIFNQVYYSNNLKLTNYSDDPILSPWIAVGSYSTILISTDGITWTGNSRDQSSTESGNKPEISTFERPEL